MEAVDSPDKEKPDTEPKRKDISKMCASCHSTFQRWLVCHVSLHGRTLLLLYYEYLEKCMYTYTYIYIYLYIHIHIHIIYIYVYKDHLMLLQHYLGTQSKSKAQVQGAAGGNGTVEEGEVSQQCLHLVETAGGLRLGRMLVDF